MNYEDCSQLQEEGKSPAEITMNRCNCLIRQYLLWKKDNKRWSNLSQGATLILTAIIPIVLLMPWERVNIIGAAFSALAAIATGLLTINGWRENFIRYGYIYHMLQVEKYLYLTQATKEYQAVASQKDADFAKRIEALVTLDVTEWRTEMQRIEERSQ